jgi:hypothetical protein
VVREPCTQVSPTWPGQMLMPACRGPVQFPGLIVKFPFRNHPGQPPWEPTISWKLLAFQGPAGRAEPCRKVHWLETAMMRERSPAPFLQSVKRTFTCMGQPGATVVRSRMIWSTVPKAAFALEVNATRRNKHSTAHPPRLLESPVKRDVERFLVVGNCFNIVPCHPRWSGIGFTNKGLKGQFWIFNNK